MQSVGTIIDQLLQSRRYALLTHKEPKKELHAVHREKRLGVSVVPNRLLASVQATQTPLFISLNSRLEEMAMNRQRKRETMKKKIKEQKRTRSEYICNEECNSKRKKIKQDELHVKPIEIEQSHNGDKGKSGNDISSSNYRSNDNRTTLPQSLQASKKEQTFKPTSRFSVRQSMSLATVAKQAFVHDARKTSSSANTTTISTTANGVGKSNNNNVSSSNTNITNKSKLLVKNNVYNIGVNKLSNSINKSITRKRIELPKRSWTARKICACLCNVSRAATLRRHWRVRDFMFCQGKDQETERARSNTLLSETFVGKPKCTALMLRKRRKSILQSAFTQFNQMEQVHEQIGTQDKETNVQVNKTINKNSTLSNNDSVFHDDDSIINTCTDQEVDKKLTLKWNVETASLTAVHAFWNIVKIILTQRRASLQRLLVSLQTTNNDNVKYTSLKLCAARSFPLFGAVVKLEWVEYVMPSIISNGNKLKCNSLPTFECKKNNHGDNNNIINITAKVVSSSNNKNNNSSSKDIHKQSVHKDAKLKVVKVQFGIVLHEELNKLEVVLLPWSTSARQSLLKWLLSTTISTRSTTTATTSTDNNTTIEAIKEGKNYNCRSKQLIECPAKNAITCSVSKLFLGSTGTRGSAIKAVSKRLRWQGNCTSHIDIMCSYVGEANSIANINVNACENGMSDRERGCEANDASILNNDNECFNLLNCLKHRYL